MYASSVYFCMVSCKLVYFAKPLAACRHKRTDTARGALLLLLLLLLLRGGGASNSTLFVGCLWE